MNYLDKGNYEEIFKPLKDTMVLMKLEELGAFIGGGCFLSIIEGREIKDVDIFFRSEEDSERLISWFDGKLLIEETLYNNPTAMMVKLVGLEAPINIVKKRFFHSIQAMFDDFDFTCTMIGFDCESGEMRMGAGFGRSVAEKVLYFNHLNKYPLTSLKRVLKYQNRGYTIPDNEMELIGMAIADLKIKSGEDFVQQVGKMYSEGDISIGTFTNLQEAMDSYRSNNPL